MKKRIWVLLLAVTLIMTSLAGCAKEDNGKEGDGEVTNIVWYWPSDGIERDGLQDVEDALNAMMEPDIGVHVTLEPVALAELVNRLTLDVSSETQVDLALTVGTGLNVLVDNNLIQPVTEIYEEYGKAILEDSGDGIYAGYYNGELYGAGPAYITTNAYGFNARKDLLDKYEIEYDVNKIYTLDEIEEIFEIVKAGEGDDFFCAAWDVSGDPIHSAAFAVDKLKAGTGSGVIMLENDFKDTTIVNLFETEEYKEFAERTYSWVQKGYVPKDLVTAESISSYIRGGNTLGRFYWTTPGAAEGVSASVGYEMVPLTTVAGYRSGDTANSVYFTVPVTSVNPEKAVAALNYIYEHDEAAWLLQFGIEGVSYEIVEESDEGAIMQYLASDPSTLPYYQPYGVYGNRLAWPVTAPSPIDINAQMIAFDEAISAAGERVSEAYGYAFISSSVDTELAAVNAVISQYAPSLNAGAANPAEILPEFQAALKAAGIDKIIAENQKQLDAWLAEK